jgi:hypothetical protein
MHKERRIKRIAIPTSRKVRPPNMYSDIEEEAVRKKLKDSGYLD